jgi:hypothetical protein
MPSRAIRIKGWRCSSGNWSSAAKVWLKWIALSWGDGSARSFTAPRSLRTRLLSWSRR